MHLHFSLLSEYKWIWNTGANLVSEEILKQKIVSLSDLISGRATLKFNYIKMQHHHSFSSTCFSSYLPSFWFDLTEMIRCQLQGQYIYKRSGRLPESVQASTSACVCTQRRHMRSQLRCRKMQITAIRLLLWETVTSNSVISSLSNNWCLNKNTVF